MSFRIFAVVDIARLAWRSRGPIVVVLGRTGLLALARLDAKAPNVLFILTDDIRSISGTLLCTKGEVVTRSMRARLRNYLANAGSRTPIKAFVPVDPSQDGAHAAAEPPIQALSLPVTSTSP